MLTIMLFCLLTVAAAQYQYSPPLPLSNYNNVQPGSVVGDTPSSVANPNSIQSTQSVAYNKEYFSYAAPAQDFQNDFNANNLLQSLKRNLRIIFIRAPENNGLENVAAQLVRSAAEDRTAIYVLNKQFDPSNLAAELQNIQSQGQNKPEVHFVRYRTEADALNAQNAIQSQYDTLPGQTINHNDISAHVHNFPATSQSAHAPSSVSEHVDIRLPATGPLPLPAPPSTNYLPSQNYFK